MDKSKRKRSILRFLIDLGKNDNDEDSKEKYTSLLSDFWLKTALARLESELYCVFG